MRCSPADHIPRSVETVGAVDADQRIRVLLQEALHHASELCYRGAGGDLVPPGVQLGGGGGGGGKGWW